MKKGTAFLFTGLVLVYAGSALASDQQTKQPAKEAVEISTPECDTCARRHDAYARIRKQREKKRLTPVLKPAQRPEQSEAQ